MRRIDTPELLDSNDCPPEEAARSLRDLGNINRWFGGVSTTQALVEKVVRATGLKNFSLLEVAAGFGDVPKIVARNLAHRGITLEVTLLDRVRSHLLPGRRALVADALALPFRDGEFDLVSSNLFVHHLGPEQLREFVRESLRVCRHAVLINDLIRHPLHLGLVYAGFPLMRSPLSRTDGVASVKRAYVPEEICEILKPMLAPGQSLTLSRHYLFRMGVIVWNRRT